MNIARRAARYGAVVTHMLHSKVRGFAIAVFAKQAPRTAYVGELAGTMDGCIAVQFERLIATACRSIGIACEPSTI